MVTTQLFTIMIIFVMHFLLLYHALRPDETVQLLDFIGKQIRGREMYKIVPPLTAETAKVKQNYQLQRVAFRLGLAIGWMTTANFVSKRDKLVTKGRPVFVISYMNKLHLHQFLQNVSGENRWGLGRSSHPTFSSRKPTKTTWMIFLEDDNVDDIFRDIEVPFDSEVIVVHDSGSEAIISEVFRHEGAPLRRAALGRWSAAGRAEWSAGPRVRRRGDLSGRALRAYPWHNPPLTIVNEEKGQLRVSGVIGDLWNTLQVHLNFTTEYQQASKITRFPHHLVRKVSRLETDVIIGDMPMTVLNVQHSKFLVPIIFRRSYVYITHPGYKKQMFALIKPFQMNLWTTLGGLIFLIAGILTLFRKHNFIEEFFNVIYIFWLQDADDPEESGARKAVYLVAYVTSLMISTAYSASLVSHLFARNLELPFNDIRGMVRQRGYNVCFPFGSVQGDMVIYSRVIVKSFKPCWLSSMEDVGRLARSGHLVVFLPEYQAQGLDVPSNCSLLRLQGLSARAMPSITMSRKTPYWGLLNDVVLRLRENGVGQRLIVRERALAAPPPAAPPPPAPVAWDAVASAELCLAAGAVLACALLLAETAHAHARNRHRRRRRRTPR